MVDGEVYRTGMLRKNLLWVGEGNLRKLNMRRLGPSGIAVVGTLLLALPILVIMTLYAARGWLGN